MIYVVYNYNIESEDTMEENNTMISVQSNEPIQSNEPNKKKRPGLIILIIVILIIIVGGSFLYLNKDKLLKEKETKEPEQTEKEEKEEETKSLDLTKCLNCETNWIFKDATEKDDGTKNFTLTHNNNEVTFAIHWNEFCQFSGASACPKETVTYKVRKLDGKVKDTIVGGSGQEIHATTLYYLMEDGGVKYTKLFYNDVDQQGNHISGLNYTYLPDEKDESGNLIPYFDAEGPMEKPQDIIKLYNVQVYIENGSGWQTTIGAKKDGSFYDLRVE